MKSQLHAKPVTSNDYVELGIRLQKRGKHLESIRAYKKATKMDLNCAKGYAEWGNLLLRRKKYRPAARKYLDAIRIKPDAVSFRRWVRTLDQLGDRKAKELLAYLDGFTKRSSRYADTYLNWGRELVRRRRYAEAEEKFYQAIKLRPNDGPAFRLWGDALYEGGVFESAGSKYLDGLEFGGGLDCARWVHALERLDNCDRLSCESRFRQIAQDQKSLLFYRYWADQLVKVGRYDDANDKYNKAGRDASVYSQWGNLRLAEEKYEEALTCYREAIALDPTVIDYERLVNTLEKTGGHEVRRWSEEYRRIAENKKNSASNLYAEGYRRWGDALARAQSYSAAFQQYQESINLNPVEAETYVNWGLTLQELSNNSEAAKKYQQATRCPGVKAIAFVNWANLLFSQNDFDGALKKYLQAILLDKSSIDYSNWVTALTKCKTSTCQGVVDQISIRAQTDPEYASVYSRWGSALLLKGDYKAAFNKFRQATELNGDFVEAYVAWGDALSQAGHWAQAALKYQRVLESDYKKVDYKKLIRATDNLTADEKRRLTSRIDEFIGDDYKFAKLYALWADALTELNRFEEALVIYKKALDLDHDYAGVYDSCGWALTSLDQFEKAVQKYGEALEIDPERSASYYGAAYALAGLKDYEGAIEKYEKASALEPSNIYYHINCGIALTGLKEYGAGLEKYEQAARLDPGAPITYFSWGNGLAEMNRYEEAYEKFNQAIQASTEDRDATYAANNIGDYLYQQGRYKEGREAWEKARRAYALTSKEALDAFDVDYFHYYGLMLQTIFNEPDEAERAYQQGLKLRPDHVGILTALVTMYIDLKDESVNESGTTWYWRARECYQRAEIILSRRIESTKSAGVFLQCGQLRLALGEYLTQPEMDSAEDFLQKALARDQDSADIYTNLGVLYARKKDFRKAMQNFTDSLRIKPGNLSVWSNLAEVYLKSAIAENSEKKSLGVWGDGRLKETAEKEFRRILDVAPTHLESLLGLGEVYKAMGEDTKDEDLFVRAIGYFGDAIRFADSYAGSKRLKRKELAAAYYSIGYCKVKLYEASRKLKDESLLREAQDFFTMSLDKDPQNYSAKLAMEKLDKRLAFSSQRLLEKLGPWLILPAAVAIFLLAQVSIIWRTPLATIEGGYYSLLSFGSLLFAVVGLYLPQLLKLKVGGIELQKSAVDQIATPDNLGINK